MSSSQGAFSPFHRAPDMTFMSFIWSSSPLEACIGESLKNKRGFIFFQLSEENVQNRGKANINSWDYDNADEDGRTKRWILLIREILKRTQKRYQDPVLWAWFQFFFSLQRYQFSDKITRQLIFTFLLSHFLRLNTLKGTARAPSLAPSTNQSINQSLFKKVTLNS